MKHKYRIKYWVQYRISRSMELRGPTVFFVGDGRGRCNAYVKIPIVNIETAKSTGHIPIVNIEIAKSTGHIRNRK